MSAPANKTIRELINDVSFKFAESDIYYGHGTDNAFDEAVYLVFAELDIPFDIDDAALNREVDSEQALRISQLARMRIQERKPVAYLVNKAWFAGIEFYVDDRVLVPRSPIAELIENRFQPWLESTENINSILDIGTGSACIAIAAARAFPGATVDAIDISTDALEVAAVNVDRYQLADKVSLIQSDLYAGLEGRQYDLIIANPPYVDGRDMADLPEEFRHEPQLGLAAGTDGLDIVRRLIADAANHLTTRGLLVVEVGNSQPALENAYPGLPFTWPEFERGGDGVFLLAREDLQR